VRKNKELPDEHLLGRHSLWRLAVFAALLDALIRASSSRAYPPLFSFSLPTFPRELQGYDRILARFMGDVNDLTF